MAEASSETNAVPNARMRWLDHIADVGMEIEAESLEALFVAALDGLTAVMLSAPPTTADGSSEIRLSAGSVETLLVEWLEEWIFLIQTERRVPVSVDLEIMPGSDAALASSATTPVGHRPDSGLEGGSGAGPAAGPASDPESSARWELLATVADAALDPDRHGWRGEVKGATYHGLDVLRNDTGWQARIVLDV